MDISNVITNNQNKIIDASLNEIAKQQYLQKKQEYYDRVKIESVNMICRQTDYSEDEAKERLEKYNYNYQMISLILKKIQKKIKQQINLYMEK